MSKRVMLDFDILSSFEPPGVFIQVSREVEDGLKKLPETQERVEGCLRFCSHVAYEPANPNGDASEDTKRRQKYLRAALAEYVSMEDAASWDFQACGRADPPQIMDLTDPRLHIVRLLRHSNIHLRASRLSQDCRPAIWNSPDGPREFEFRMFIAEKIEQAIRSTRQAGNYVPSELDRMISWLESEQRAWGIPNVIHRAAETYAQSLVC